MWGLFSLTFSCECDAITILISPSCFWAFFVASGRVSLRLSMDGYKIGEIQVDEKSPLSQKVSFSILAYLVSRHLFKFVDTQCVIPFASILLHSIEESHSCLGLATDKKGQSSSKCAKDFREEVSKHKPFIFEKRQIPSFSQSRLCLVLDSF